MVWDSHTDCITIRDDGNAAMRIHGEESRRIESAERAAGIDMLVRQFELADQPHHLLDVERTAPSPHLQH